MIKAALLACIALLPWAAFFFRTNKTRFVALSILDLAAFLLLFFLKINPLYCFFFLAAAGLINAALLFAEPQPREQTPFNFLVLIVVLLCAGAAAGFVYQAGVGPAVMTVPAWEQGLALVCAALIFFAGFYAVKKGEKE